MGQNYQYFLDNRNYVYTILGTLAWTNQCGLHFITIVIPQIVV